MSLEEICSLAERFIAAPGSSQFDDLAREVFGFQFEHNEPYRRFCEARGVSPASLKSVEEIPAVITSAFKELELSCVPASKRSKVFYSSGTTAQNRSRHFHSEGTLHVYEQSLLRWFRPNVLGDCARANFLILTPRENESPHSSLVHMFETIARHFAASHGEFCGRVDSHENWSLEFDEILRADREFASENIPVVICGTAFSFVHLCDFLIKQRQTLSFPAGSRVFETGGYKGRSRLVPKADLHRMIAERLSIPKTCIISEYGMAELSSQAYDRRPGESGDRIYTFPPWARVLVVSPESGEPVGDGETGLLRVLDLANVGSVMAIQTEDIARRRGAGFELLGRGTQAEPRGCSLMLATS